MFYRFYHCMILLAGIVFTAPVAFAQKDVDKAYEEAVNAFYNEHFHDALILFAQLEDLKPGYKDAEYKAEICSLVLKENREKPLDKILSYEGTKGTTDKFYPYWMGRIYANRYMFPEAVESWKAFLGQKVFKSKEIVAETRNFISEAEMLVSYFDNPDNYEIHQLGETINTPYAEITPVFFADKDELLFASNRGSHKGDEFRIYESPHTNTNGWKDPAPIKSLGALKRENCNIEVAGNQRNIYFFNQKKGKLYVTSKGGENWDEPVEFDNKLNETNMAAHFFIREGLQTVIFTAKSGKTALDLYFSVKEEETGKWSRPEPLPGDVNTVDDEDCPFLSPDGKRIYFSSNRPGGLGGFDVYFSELDETTGKWREPINMGWPINSPDDEIHFKMTPNENSGYFSSNRIHSRGDYDIFFFWPIEKISITGRISDYASGMPLTNGEIRLHPSQYLDQYFRSPIDENGGYHTQIISDEVYKVEILQNHDTLMIEYFEIHLSGQTNETYQKDFIIGAPEVAITVNTNTSEIGSEPSEGRSDPDTKAEKSIADGSSGMVTTKTAMEVKHILYNVYFQFGTSTLTAESDEALEIVLDMMSNRPNLKIEIAGHTDSVGPDEFNDWMSLKRAEAVKNWLVTRGINGTRISTVGYGESRPLASNDDEENGRELNRRIEVREL